MNLIEAIRTGMPFRKKGDEKFFHLVDSMHVEYTFIGTRQEWIREDWEIDEEKYPLTNVQAFKLYALGKRHGGLIMSQEDEIEELKDLQKELGLRNDT